MKKYIQLWFLSLGLMQADLAYSTAPMTIFLASGFPLQKLLIIPIFSCGGSFAKLSIDQQFPTEFTQIQQALSVPNTTLQLAPVLTNEPNLTSGESGSQAYLNYLSESQHGEGWNFPEGNNFNMNFTVSSTTLPNFLVQGIFPDIVDEKGRTITSFVGNMGPNL